ncbi:facilitated trehalose transporter Tret1-like [Hyposmocoma kahamanoa]|uniref:facilitated trehalose transporter Tret1-like n=1 Tax=Hyposmocoma kahamanoa TaxID=1477025 RepID=UPI000E6D9735|nr:facilitated trehalose transporter Tret1-like [Hyposmocoma kahamanoa]
MCHQKLTTNLSLLTYGLQIGWVSPMAVILQSTSSPTGYALSSTAISWIGSTMALAAVFGVPLFSYLADVYGRKIAMLALSLPQALSWLLKLSSANMTTIIIARIFCGLSAGGCFAVVPMYVKEISQDNIRGQLGSLLIMFQNIGLLIMFILGAYLGYFTTLYSVIWLPFLTFLMLLKAPESPAYLFKIGKVNFAEELEKDTNEIDGVSY